MSCVSAGQHAAAVFICAAIQIINAMAAAHANRTIHLELKLENATEGASVHGPACRKNGMNDQGSGFRILEYLFGAGFLQALLGDPQALEVAFCSRTNP